MFKQIHCSNEMVFFFFPLVLLLLFRQCNCALSIFLLFSLHIHHFEMELLAIETAFEFSFLSILRFVLSWCQWTREKYWSREILWKRRRKNVEYLTYMRNAGGGKSAGGGESAGGGKLAEERALAEEGKLTKKESQAEKKALNAKETSTDRAKKNKIAYNGPHHIGKCHTILQGFYFIGVYFMNLANHKVRALIFLSTSLVGCCAKWPRCHILCIQWEQYFPFARSTKTFNTQNLINMWSQIDANLSFYWVRIICTWAADRDLSQTQK